MKPATWMLGAAILCALATSSAAATTAPKLPSDPNTLRGLDLRTRNGVATPTASTIIYIDSVAVHHIYAEQSLIAWRDESGVWRVSKVSEQGPGGLLRVERKLESKSERTLKPEQARELDRLVLKSGLKRMPISETPPRGVGAPSHTMEIVTPKGTRTVSWGGRLLDRLGRIADILLND